MQARSPVKSCAMPAVVTVLALSFAVACGDDDDNGGGEGAKAAEQLRSCGVISEGTFVIPDPETDEDKCFADCFLKASCEDTVALFCTDDEDPVVSDSFRECTSVCTPTFECDGEDMPVDFKCDGFDDCEDGSDEKDCPEVEPETFTCDNGDVVQSNLPIECDGLDDCDDGSDEADCGEPSGFECEDGELVEEDAECDLTPDCQDGSDEHDGCAKLTCDEE